MTFDEIKILVIEDEKKHFCGIRDGVCKLTEDSDEFISKFNKDNIHWEEVNRDNPMNYSKIKKIIEDKFINCLFIDLWFGNTKNIEDEEKKLEGLRLIDELMKDDTLKYIPKYIISGATTIKEIKYGLDDKKDTHILQYAYFIEKPPSQIIGGLSEKSNLSEDYYDIFLDENLTTSLSVLVDMYNVITRKFKTHNLLKNIVDKLEDSQIKNEDILKYLQLQEKIIDNINITTSNIHERIKLIEIITKSIAKALPKIADKKKAKNIIETWENDDEFKNIMGDDMPEISKGLYTALKDGLNNILDDATDDISKVIYDAGKEYIDSRAGISDDDGKIVLLMKYSSFFAEKVWEAKKAII